MKEKKNSIKGKIIGGFVLALLAMLLTGIISYNSYKELLSSLDQPSYPEVKLKELNQILADISEAEAGMRAYALTRDGEFLTTYRNLASTIHHDFDSLKTIEPIDPHFNQRIDSIARLLNDKIVDVNSFIALKKTLSEVNFSLRALEEISNSTDSVPALRTTKTTTTTTTTLENLPKSTKSETPQEIIENNKRKKRKRVQELAKQIAKLEMEPKIQTEIRIITDTSFIKPDTVLGSISRILEEVSEEESRYQRVLANKELELIEGNILIIDQIRTLINNLEKDQLALSISQANRAKIIASRSNLTVSIIIILCLITGLALIYLIFKDISFRNFYNQQLIGAKNQAEQLAESKQQFLANMSHEIRTPLNAIIGFSEQLKHTPLQGPQKKYLSAVQWSSQHLLDTVNDILDYSKIEAGELKIEKRPFDFRQTLQEVIDTLQIKAQEKGLSLELEMEGVATVYLLGDPLRLKQILFNLVSNGIKFTDSGFVKVRCEIKPGQVHQLNLTVEDSGIGIRKEILGEIFNDFNQADLSDTRKYEGTGLGLAICKKLVEIQGGTIKVESTPGKGSRFLVHLKYAQSEVIPQAEDHTVKVQPQVLNQKASILVVDDDELNLSLLEIILSRWGLHVELCSSGNEALKALSKNDYDLILTDIHMPEVSGLDLCSYLRSHEMSHKKNLPIIALTANVMENDLEHYLNCGINDVLLKPYQEAELFEKIKTYLPVQADLPLSTEQVNKFSLKDFKKFSGDDETALLSILNSFYDNLSKNLEELTLDHQQGDLRAVADMAHKMISSFGHLHAQQIIEILRDVENLARTGDPEGLLGEKIARVDTMAKPVQTALYEEITTLKESVAN